MTAPKKNKDIITPSLHTSYSLLNRVKDQNDQESWKEFISYYEKYIYNILRRMNINPADAEEIRQEIILKLWKHLPDFVYDENRGKFRQWLATVIKNDARTYIRKNKKKDEATTSSEDVSPNEMGDILDNADIEKIIHSEWNRYVSNLAWEAIKPKIHEKTQKVFLLFSEGMDRKEIAKTCDLSLTSVNVYIQRVRNHLIDAIEHINSELL